MLRGELLRQVRRIELQTRRLMDSVLSGQYRSYFKGQGVQFSEHRPYVPGDDVRHINWKVSARTKEPLVKQFEEERELTVFLVVDVSASNHFASSHQLKNQLIAEVGGMLAYAASLAGDRVGVLFFSDQVEKIVPPQRGRQHALRVIRDLLQQPHVPKNRGSTQLGSAMDAAARVMKHRGIIFLLSDFIVDLDYSRSLKRLAQKHDVTGIWITDERELSFPKLGHLVLTHPETLEEFCVDSSSSVFQKWVKERSLHFEETLKKNFRQIGSEFLKILTQEDHAQTLVRFFQARSMRRK